MSLPRKFNEDVIFGPKYSFAIIGRNSFKIKDIDKITYNLALDSSIFDQRGCNSPHTVFIENDDKIDPLTFAKHLSKNMEKVLKRIPKAPISEKAYSIVNTLELITLFWVKYLNQMVQSGLLYF